jgi:DNA-directed RNA polymerase I subunit RPA1
MATFARPVASAIAGINFDIYSDTDVKAISVKRIHNTPTLDSFNNPVPGGLYDPAMGAWGDHVYAILLCLFTHFYTFFTLAPKIR